MTVCDAFGAGVTLLHRGVRLDFRVLAEGQAPVTVDDEKSVGRTVDRAVERQRPRYRPPRTTPGTAWRESPWRTPPPGGMWRAGDR